MTYLLSVRVALGDLVEFIAEVVYETTIGDSVLLLNSRMRLAGFHLKLTFS